MKRFFTLIAFSLLSLSPLLAQNHIREVTEIAEAERKAAHALTTFTANEHTANYNIVYHKLEFTADPAEQYIRGTITTNYIAKADMTEIVFDLNDVLTVSSVTQNGNSLAFVQNEDDELVITLAAIQPTGTQASIVVTYEGAPPTTERSFVASHHNGVPVLWTLSEPYGAKDWWPCKQDLNDKIDSIDVFITAPAEYTSVSNGLEIAVTETGPTTKTTHFRHNYPIPAYLIAIAITNYSIFTQQAGSGEKTFPIVNYLYPETQNQHEQSLAVTVPIMDFFEEKFETYPFYEEKYGHAQCGFGGGMEHTTVSFMGGFSRTLIAHELAHQWFGDKITCGSWKDIWLNEGFATYLSGLVVEQFDGSDAFRMWKTNMVANITSQGWGNLYLRDADTLNVSRIFNSRITYNKGAMVLHMLRYKLGDANFYQAVKNYLADPELAYGYAVTPQLQAHLEIASGIDLTEFFADWVYNEGYPIYDITAENTEPGKANIIINQTQADPSVSFFEMPVPLRLFGADGQTQDALLENTINGEEFTVDVPFVVIDIQYNPNSDIISTGSTAKVLSENFKPYLSPVPASATLTAHIPDGVAAKKALFFNAIGQLVGETYGQSVWDVSRYASGVYFIELETTKGTTDLKFIKN